MVMMMIRRVMMEMMRVMIGMMVVMMGMMVVMMSGVFGDELGDVVAMDDGDDEGRPYTVRKSPKKPRRTPFWPSQWPSEGEKRPPSQRPPLGLWGPGRGLEGLLDPPAPSQD